jgi:hypothetical protein
LTTNAGDVGSAKPAVAVPPGGVVISIEDGIALGEEESPQADNRMEIPAMR